MLGSPNPGYFTYDGDQSVAAERQRTPLRGCRRARRASSATLVAYLKDAGKTAQDTGFDGRSDYDGFTQAGFPSGGLFSGAEEKKTAEQAELWGGEADEPFDPNYHKKTDTLDHIDRTRSASTAAGSATPSASTRRIRAAATASRSATTAPGTYSAKS